MAAGTLCMIVCPILEDELVHNIVTDPDKKNCYLVTTDYNKTLIPKLKNNSIEYEEINEADFLAGKIELPKDEYNIVMWLRSLGLHSDPKNLREKILEDLLKVDGICDGIMLYYGLCGQGLLGICDWAKEKMKTPLTIFKGPDGRICDDCICVPLGGCDQYLQLLRKHPGVMYLTPAMACSQDEFMNQNELFQGLDQVDMSREEFMLFMLEMAGYTQTMKIQTGLGDQEHFQQECEAYAKKYHLELIELDPKYISTEVADRTYAEAKSFLR